MVLLIQYKTVRLYTPLEHKNLSLAAGADDTGLFMEILGQKPDCWHNLRTLPANFPRFPGVFYTRRCCLLLKLVLSRWPDFFYQYWTGVCRFPEFLYLAKRYDINTPSGTHSCWSNWGFSCRTESSAIISSAITISGKRLETMRSNDTCLCRILSTLLKIVPETTEAICTRSLISRVLHYYSPALFQIPCGIKANW